MVPRDLKNQGASLCRGREEEAGCGGSPLAKMSAGDWQCLHLLLGSQDCSAGAAEPSASSGQSRAKDKGLPGGWTLPGEQWAHLFCTHTFLHLFPSPFCPADPSTPTPVYH